MNSSPRSRSISTFLILILYLVGIKLTLTFLPNIFRSPAQAAVFEWKFLAIWTILGLTGVILSERTGFPDPFDPSISFQRRLALPAILGIAFGLVAIATDIATHWTKLVAAQMHLSSIHIEFPASLLIYPGGAVIVEIIYRLFPVPFLLWLSNLLLKGKAQAKIFWILAALTSLIEPLGDLGLKKYGIGMMLAVFAEDYSLNFAQAWLFRRCGFLTAILMRVWFYLVWHVLYGIS